MASDRFTTGLEPQLKDRQARRQSIQDAVAEAEKGEFISEKAMTAWFLSLGTETELPEPQPDVFLRAGQN